MNKIVIIVGILVVLTGGVVLLYQFLLNPIESVTVRTGSYFDESGKKLGSCKEERTLRKLDSGPGSLKTFYSDNSERSVGYCEGDEIGCFVSLTKEPRVCKPANLQMQCDRSIYSVGFGAKAKYNCVLDAS